MHYLHDPKQETSQVSTQQSIYIDGALMAHGTFHSKKDKQVTASDKMGEYYKQGWLKTIMEPPAV